MKNNTVSFFLFKKRFTLFTKYLLILLLLFSQSFGLIARQKETTSKNIDKVTDIDKNIYKVRVIGNQLWMAENLKVVHFKNGDPIENVTDSKNWIKLNTGAWVNYENDYKMYDNIYGKLYNWYVVNDSRGVCPEGWRIPKITDWEILLKHLEAVNDPIGLAMIPGGLRNGENGNFLYSGDDGYLWADEKNSVVYGWNRDMPPNGAGMYRQVVPRTNGHSIRCIKDE